MSDDEFTTVGEIREMLDGVEEWVNNIRAQISSMSPEQRLTAQRFAVPGWQPLTRGCQLRVVKVPDPGPTSTTS